MSKEEFEADYILNSKMTKETYDLYFVTLPCKCGEDNCKGWACVGNSEVAIKTHNDLYT